MRLTLAVLLSATILAATPRAARPESDPLQFPYGSVVFPTGMRLAAVRIAGAERATVVTSYAAPASEPPGKAGVALLALRLGEHARPGRGGFTLAERLFAAGALSFNELGLDDLEIRTLVRAQRLDEVLSVEADRMLEPFAGITSAEFERERDGLAAQLELVGDDPDLAQGQLRALLRRALPGTAVDRPPATAGSVRALTFEDVRAWAREVLDPARAVLVVTGPEEPRAVALRVYQAFGRAASAKAGGAHVAPFLIPALALPPSRRGAGELVSLRSAEAVPRLWIGWPVPGDGSGQIAHLAAAAVLVEARIRTQLGRSGEERVERLSVDTMRANGVSMLVVHADLRAEGDARKIRDVVLDAASSGPDGREFLGVQGEVRREAFDLVPLAAEHGTIPGGARLARVTGSADLLAARRDLASRLTKKELERWIEDHLREDRATALLFLTSSDVPSAMPEPPVGGARLAVELLASAAPGPAQVRALVGGAALGSAVRRQLPNGLTVLLVPRGDLPIVEARLVIRPDLPEHAGGFAADILALTSARKRWTASEAWECHGASTLSVPGALVFRELTGTAGLPVALDRLACWTRRTVDEDTFDRVRDALARQYDALVAGRRRGASELSAAAYGELHRAPPSASAFRTLEAATARAWLDAQLRPDRALLVVAGDVADPGILAEVNRRFGHWKRGEVPARPARRPEPTARQIVLVDAPGAARAHVDLALRIPPAGAANPAAEAVLGQLLRLRLARVVPPGGDLAVRFDGYADEPLLRATLSVPPQAAADVVRKSLDELASLAQAPLPEADVTFGRWLAARNAAFAFDTAPGAGAAAQELFLRSASLDGWDRFGEDLAAVDGVRVRETAARLGVGREVVVVTGDAARIEPALRALGLAPRVVPAPKATRAPAPAAR